MIDALQYHDDGFEQDRAGEILEALREQEGFLAGRIMPSKNFGSKFSVQAFFEAEGEPGSPLPENMRWVKIPESMLAAMGCASCEENPSRERGFTTGYEHHDTADLIRRLRKLEAKGAPRSERVPVTMELQARKGVNFRDVLRHVNPSKSGWQVWKYTWSNGYGGIPETLLFGGEVFPTIAAAKHAWYDRYEPGRNDKATYVKVGQKAKSESEQEFQERLSRYPAAQKNPDLGPYRSKSEAQKAFKRSSLRFGKARARYEKLSDGWYFSPVASRSNPESEAAAVYEEFHGTPSTEIIEVEEAVHFHEHLASLGRLVSIKVETPRGKKREIQFPPSGPATYLATNEAKDQLFVEGGDQTLNLQDLGFRDSDYREMMLIGDVTEVTYRTQKSMHNLELTDYYHALGEETGQLPVLLYDTRSEKLSFAGGEYSIRPEGIVN